MNSKRRALCAALCAALTLTATAPAAYASAEEPSVISIDDLLRYSYISRISSGLIIKDGTAYCDGSYSAYKDYDASFYILLQRSKTQVDWTDLQKWTADFSTSGPHLISGERSLMKGYSYRVIAHVEINGKSAEAISPIKHY